MSNVNYIVCRQCGSHDIKLTFEEKDENSSSVHALCLNCKDFTIAKNWDSLNTEYKKAPIKSEKKETNIISFGTNTNIDFKDLQSILVEEKIEYKISRYDKVEGVNCLLIEICFLKNINTKRIFSIISEFLNEEKTRKTFQPLGITDNKFLS